MQLTAALNCAILSGNMQLTALAMKSEMYGWCMARVICNQSRSYVISPGRGICVSKNEAEDSVKSQETKWNLLRDVWFSATGGIPSSKSGEIELTCRINSPEA